MDPLLAFRCNEFNSLKPLVVDWMGKFLPALPPRPETFKVEVKCTDQTTWLI